MKTQWRKKVVMELGLSKTRLICRKCKKQRLPSAFVTQRGKIGEVCCFCKQKADWHEIRLEHCDR